MRSILELRSKVPLQIHHLCSHRTIYAAPIESMPKLNRPFTGITIFPYTCLPALDQTLDAKLMIAFPWPEPIN